MAAVSLPLARAEVCYTGPFLIDLCQKRNAAAVRCVPVDAVHTVHGWHCRLKQPIQLSSAA
jgi:hypothetical protein